MRYLLPVDQVLQKFEWVVYFFFCVDLVWNDLIEFYAVYAPHNLFTDKQTILTSKNYQS